MNLLLAILFFTSYPKEIHIVPLGKVSRENIETASAVIREFYGTRVVVDREFPLEKKYKNIGNDRYSAERILQIFNSSYHQLILTEQDITVFHKIKKKNWGVFGLGYINGTTSVVSAYRNRLGRNATKELLKSRLRKVIVHEIGHNLGLNHCTYDQKCVMHAAEGKALQIDREAELFCPNCKKRFS